MRDLTGHGIGTKLHEAPEIPNFVQRRRGAKMQKGMALAIEPMINEGTYDVYWLDNDWTVATVDGKLSAHYENTIAITDEGCEILTMLPEEKKLCIVNKRKVIFINFYLVMEKIYARI